MTTPVITSSGADASGMNDVMQNSALSPGGNEARKGAQTRYVQPPPPPQEKRHAATEYWLTNGFFLSPLLHAQIWIRVSATVDLPVDVDICTRPIITTLHLDHTHHAHLAWTLVGNSAPAAAVAARGNGRGRGGRGRGRGGKRADRPATTEADLDAEMEDYQKNLATA